MITTPLTAPESVQQLPSLPPPSPATPTELSADSRPPSSCAANENILISVGDDKGVLLWDLTGKKEFARIENNRIIKSVEPLSDTVVATGNDDGAPLHADG